MLANNVSRQADAADKTWLERLHDDGFALHPNYLLRVCGEPANLTLSLSDGQCQRHVDDILQLEHWLEANKEDYCGYVETCIKGLDDKAASNKLLKIKRNIFNCRPISTNLLADVEHVFDADSFRQVQDIVERINRLEQCRQELEQVYQNESDAISAQLNAVWQSKNLRHALSYSNPKIFEDLEALYQRPEKKIKRKKRRQLEAGLLRYASRSSLKTSPLSTFTPVFVGHWRTAKSSRDIELSGELTHRMEVKASLFQAIMHSLLSDYQRIKADFPIKLNPSMQLVDGQIQLKRVVPEAGLNGRVWGTGEVDVKLNANQMIQCLFVAFQQLQQSEVLADELIAKVLTLAPKLEANVVDSYLAKLFDAQVFVVESGFYNQTELTTWAAQVLQRSSDAGAQQALAHLQQLEELLDEFPQLAAEQRLQSARRINDGIAAFADALQATPAAELQTPAFFENSYFVDDEVAVEQAFLEPFADDFKLLTELSVFFDVHQLAQTNFADFFVDRFGVDGECQDAAAFIDDFANRYGAGLPDFVADPSQLVKPSAITTEFKQAIATFTDYLLTQVFANDQQQRRVEQVQLDSAQLRQLLATVPAAIRERGASHSFLGQIAQADNQPLFVLNQVFSGHSGLLSRFFEVLGSDKINNIKDYLSAVSRDGESAEISGLFGFNANKHPQLTEQELQIPPFANNREETEKLALHQLTLVYDQLTHKVFFKSPTGRLLDCFYHGFLMPLLLPNLHRILTLLNMNGVLIYVLPILRSGRFSTREDISLIPRVSVGNVVLIRKSYMVPRELLPSAELPEAEFFAALQRFIQERQLPQSGFVRVSPFDTNPGSTDSKLDWSKLDFKNMKPFYVDFRNPRLVQLLYIALNRNDYPIVISEPLPDVDDQHVTVQQQPHVAEFQFEITKKPGTFKGQHHSTATQQGG
ncbi:lantibiotic dehydratase [Idiomarina xiamenensis]|uniref:Lantibiotic dehydratase domain-containing protein n=1 Tax=Idiomarina xiamenensis 10-D-4 TaxID=740709 RepID=K2KYA5_9GAMM|nr:lantibiotic dehydratase [Idiomarina xiamenensis]EKE87549.1 lantibiotic dehydratase domain-containing protein [Idiomarina xiamenensis 10-D-4]